MSERTSRTRAFPTWLLLAMLCNVLWMGWLEWYAALPATSDATCFQQPAYMKLHTGRFSIPSYAGQGPSIDKINSYPATMYFLANYAAFRVAGFSVYSATAVDLLIHLAVSSLGAWAIWRLTRCQLPAVLFVACSSQWLLPSGRPEILGIFFILISVLTLSRGKWGFAVSILTIGLAGATSPGAAIVGTALVVALDGFSRRFKDGFWRRAALLLTLPILISITAYLLYTWPYTAEAWEQNRVLRANGFYAQYTVFNLISMRPRWAFSTLIPAWATLILVAYAHWRKPTWFPLGSPSANFVSAAAAAIFVGLVLNLLAQRLPYDYRHVLVLSVASLAIAITWWPSQRGYSLAGWAIAGALILIGLPMQRDIVRYSVAPLTWGPEAIDYPQAKHLVDEVVPADATVGGDGAVWTLIDDGRPFLLTRTIAEDHWPEYVISSSWSRIPAVVQSPDSAHKLEAEYEEITPGLRPHDGCYLELFGLRAPVATGHCDWYVRIWRRRPTATPAKPTPSS